MRIEWKSNLHGVARFPADYKILGEGEPAGTFEAYVAIFRTPDRPDLFGDSDIIEPGAFTLFAEVEAFLRADPTVGGVARVSAIRRPEVTEGANPEGRVCRIDFQVAVEKRLPS